MTSGHEKLHEHDKMSTSENISFSPANASVSIVELLNNHHITHTLITPGVHKPGGWD